MRREGEPRAGEQGTKRAGDPALSALAVPTASEAATVEAATMEAADTSDMGDPASFINNLGNQLQAVTRSASTQQRLAGFEELFHASFDIPGLGRFVLGRFWRAFTPFEQQEFLSLFERYVVLTYSEKLSDYTGEGRDDGRGCVHAEPPAMGAVAREGRQATRDAVSPQPRGISDRLSRLRDDPKGPLFRTIGRGTSKLTRTVLPQANAYAMIRRRAAAAGIATRLGNHSFRATGITAYLKNGGTLEKNRGDGEPRFDAHDAALRSPARRAQPR